MNTDLVRAQKVLAAEGCTCVLCKGDVYYKSARRGVAPLIDWLEEGIDARGFSAADKVVGKATAFLYCLLGVAAVHANVISKPALNVLQTHNVPVTWGQLVDAIQNRTGDGLCPMEMATREVTEPADAPAAIRAALARLTEKKQ